MPVYKEENGKKIFVAVVALDVTLSYLQDELGLSLEDLKLQFTNSIVYYDEPSFHCNASLDLDVENFSSPGDNKIKWDTTL